jgi:hypothetical protein
MPGGIPGALPAILALELEGGAPAVLFEAFNIVVRPPSYGS